MKQALSGDFGKELVKSNAPMIVIGSSLAEHPDAKAFFEVIAQFVIKNEKAFFKENWNGYNVLQRVIVTIL